MANTAAHLTESAVEQLADGLLAGPELERAKAHLNGCIACTARLEASKALIEALSTLPRFAPSENFADAVMSNIQIKPRRASLLAWVRHWTPETRRGWALLVATLLAPMLPLLAFTVWVMQSPVLTAGSVIQWTYLQGRQLLSDGSATVARWAMEIGVPAWLQGVLELVQQVPVDAAIVALLILAVAIPLSMWSLVRLVRTPTGNVTYAN